MNYDEDVVDKRLVIFKTSYVYENKDQNYEWQELKYLHHRLHLMILFQGFFNYVPILKVRLISRRLWE